VGRGIAIVLVPLVAACGFTVTAAPGDGAIDTVRPDVIAPDAGECVEVSQSCAGSDTLRTCAAAGGAAVDTLCTWGCLSGSPDHCGVLVPAGGALVPADLDPTGLMDVSVGPATFNGDTGVITGTKVGAFVMSTVNSVSVFRARSIRFTGTVTLVGTLPIAFASNGEIVIDGLLDARGTCVLTAAGPGGGPGGAYTVKGTGVGAGAGASSSNGAGAGGGGYGAAGGRGGNGDGTGAIAGVAYGSSTIPALVGGSGGGGGGGGGGNNGVGVGGGGGGAIQLASNTAIRIQSGGVINAGGCGGKGSNNDSNDGSGGGGSGGAILLEAPVVEVVGALTVNGGGGGGCQDVDGAAGTNMRTAAAGGDATVDGGPGGFAGMLTGVMGATNAQTGGGGGGGVGWIWVNTLTGVVSVPAPTMSPGFDDSPTTAIKGAASVQ